MKLLITGAAGGVGTLLRPRLATPGRTLRLLDIVPIADLRDGEESVTASITDLDALTEVCAGVDAILHLGGLSTEHRWDQISEVNIEGAYCLFEAARRAGVPRVVFASSNHAVGFHPKDGTEAPDYGYPRPDTFYGVSKVLGEALGSLYHDRYGLDVICLRIGSCFPKPVNARMLASWLSPDDCGRLVEAALATPDPGFRIAWGVSANTRRWWSLDEARAMGFEPLDNAEVFADEVSDEPDEFDRFLGGAFCAPYDYSEGQS
ncbi:NAD-dependent epimerase/dehydratase family protein [Actinokineospora sp. HUAS TT18]|uniref:NAD-dependent epimerase/dehydratase family protein n=1 Tax=Actinokineospora sp. HUAS TT18 TaxID=3447451 RepID=UPI003F51EC27